MASNPKKQSRQSSGSGILTIPKRATSSQTADATNKYTNTIIFKQTNTIARKRIDKNTKGQQVARWQMQQTYAQIQLFLNRQIQSEGQIQIQVGSKQPDGGCNIMENEKNKTFFFFLTSNLIRISASNPILIIFTQSMKAVASSKR